MLQVNARNGDSTYADWQLLLTRTPTNVQNISNFEESCIKLSFGNEKVAKDNYDKLKALNKPIAVINAKHNNATAAKLSTDDMGSLQPKPFLSKGARLILTRNLWTDTGLRNGTMSTVKDLLYSNGTTPPSLPVAIVVQFDQTYIGPSICPDTPNCVPITPVISTSDTLGSAYERQQFPLRLAWSITKHKSQGLTLEKAWIDLGACEK